MKKIKSLLSFVTIITIATLMNSCGSKRDPGRVYMPDMAYSRAYETYAERNDSVFTTDLVRRLWLDNYYYGDIFSFQFKKIRVIH